ncbi:hypothetical protein [Epilithonimonas sp. UC225_85]|uniref:RipA family octameric membrane protein n=1 Tax=Epilithonimonas sp. UC225_85 TaxID=3350167 RepID=UPI0036D2D65D
MNDENFTINLERYKIAIEARHKLNDDFHKWMTFYYVANGAILISLNAVYQKNIVDNDSLLLLSLLGIITSILWNFSCKGYYYWSSNWIKLIKKFEKEVYGDKLVYGFFSNEVKEGEKLIFYPFASKNISTPKLTMLFSLISIISWTSYSVYIVEEIWCKILLIVIVLLIYFILPIFVKSRKDGQHQLV